MIGLWIVGLSGALCIAVFGVVLVRAALRCSRRRAALVDYPMRRLRR